ncbi:MAG: threonine--tRNA ligase [Methanomassiliicoccales archaeon]
MRTLYIHADYMEYELKKSTPVAEEVEEGEMKGAMNEVLVAFITAEAEDEGRVEEVAQEAARDLEETVLRVGAERVLLYPYAHLSRSLSDPSTGKRLMRRIEELLAERIEVGRAAFGWYKAFRISCKGHPLSELSREIHGMEAEPEEVGEERFLILTPEGEELDPQEFQGGTECFRAMLEKEALKREADAVEETKYLRLCRKFGIQWESMSDSGHMAFNPKGALMFDLISDYATQIVYDLDLPMYNVKGTNMFSLEEPAVKEHADLFGDRLYMIETDKKRFVMRYAACHQQFAMIRNWNISYKHMPFGAFEVADSYRLEQSGETMLCFRTRRMNMPDLHVMCTDLAQAEEWFDRLDRRIFDEIRDIGRDYEMLVNFSSQEAYERHKGMLMDILKREGKPALLHFYPEGINYYWTVNIEYHIMDDMKRAREIGTVQVDVGNAHRFHITYADEEGKKQYPVILHSAIIGTIERYLYTLFDTAVLKEREGVPGYLPVWVNPEQVRILTVSEDHLDRARELADRMDGRRVRVSLDDRSVTVGKKVREAKQDWVSYVVVIGDREMGSDNLKVYVRERNEDLQMTVDQLIERIHRETGGKPFRRLYLPKEMSRRVDF